MDRSRLWAVLPVKDRGRAKQRLSGILGAQEREDLFGAPFTPAQIESFLAGVVPEGDL